MSIQSFRYTPMVNGQRGAYRSLSEICQRFPWLSEEAVRKAIGRAENALNGSFIVDRDNPNAERGKLHFWISETLAKKYRFKRYSDEKKGMLALRQDDALRYGVLGAILLTNLEHVTDPKRNTDPVTDFEKRIYRELSPTTLTKRFIDKNGVATRILPFSRKAVTETLASLLTANALVEHAERAGFYRVNATRHDVTKMAGDVTKVASRVTRVASDVTKVARHNEGMACKSCADKDLHRCCETSNTNTGSNADSHEDTKCLLLRTESLRSSVLSGSSERSAGAKKLMELINDGLALHRQKPAHPRRVIYDGDEFCEGTTFYSSLNDVEMPTQGWHEHLPYDYVVKDFYTGRPYSRKAEIKYIIEDLKLWLRGATIHYTLDDIDQFRDMLKDHADFHYEHVSELIEFLQPQTRSTLLDPRAPRKGHDFYFWARQIKTLKQFIHYRPQLVREHYVSQAYGHCGRYAGFERDKNGKPMFDYSEMAEPYLSLAFANDTTNPITYVEAEEYDSETCPEPKQGPVYFAEFVGLPTIEQVEHEFNPVSDTLLARL
jgi:hypothetical protein